MAKNYTPSVSLLNGALKINQTTPKNRKRFVVGKIAGAELKRLRESVIDIIAEHVEKEFKRKQKTGYTLSPDSPIDTYTSYNAMNTLNHIKYVEPDKFKDMSTYKDVIFPRNNTANEIHLRDREYERFDIEWQRFVKKTLKERAEKKRIQQEQDRSASLFPSLSKNKELDLDDKDDGILDDFFNLHNDRDR